jgi:hypothetical protein
MIDKTESEVVVPTCRRQRLERGSIFAAKKRAAANLAFQRPFALTRRAVAAPKLACLIPG